MALKLVVTKVKNIQKMALKMVQKMPWKMVDTKVKNILKNGTKFGGYKS